MTSVRSNRRLPVALKAVLAAAVLMLAVEAGGVAVAVAGSAPAITLSTTSGPPGTAVTIDGSGFPAHQLVAIYIDLPGPYLGQPGPTSNAQGAFSYAFIMPLAGYDRTGRIDPARIGPHAICADTDYPAGSRPTPVKACAQFTVKAVPAPSPTPTLGGQQPGSNANSGRLLLLSLAGFAVLVVIAVGAVVWVRRGR